MLTNLRMSRSSRKPRLQAKAASSRARPLAPNPAAAPNEPVYLDRSHFDGRFDAYVNPRAHNVTLIMNLDFEMGSWGNRPDGASALKAFKPKMKQVVEREWSLKFDLQPACAGEESKFHAYVQVNVDGGAAHNTVHFFPDMAGGRSGVDDNQSALKETDADIHENKRPFRPSPGAKPVERTFMQYTAAHEFGHMLGLPHPHCAGNADQCYGVKPEEAMDVMGLGSLVSKRDYAPFQTDHEDLRRRPLPGAVQRLETRGGRMSAARALASRAQRPGANRSAAEGEARSISARPSPGHALEPAVRSDFERRFGHDFARIRIHANGEAATAADRLNARAFTLGDDVVFGRGEYRPHSAEGRALIAHELTHSVQQRGRAAPPMHVAEVGDAASALEQQASQAAQAIGANRRPTVSAGVAPARIQRQEKPGALPADPLTTRPPSEIMADPLYFENGVKLVRFFGAELAILQYEDGAEFRLGLTPEHIKPPVEAVDYRTTRDQHIPSATSQPGAIRFLPRGKEAIFKMPDMAPFSFQQLDAAIGRNITFKRDAASGRIVPTEVNSLSAPRLCQALREAEADYVKEFDAFAQGGKKVAEKAKLIVEIMGFLPAGQGATKAVAERAAAKGAAAAGAGVEGSLAKKLLELIGKKGAKEIRRRGSVVRRGRGRPGRRQTCRCATASS